MKKKTTTIGVCLVALAILLVPQIIAASDLYPATMCRYNGDSHSGDDIWHPSNYNNGLQNRSGSDAGISCPLVKTGNEDLYNAYIYLSESSATCRVWKQYRTGNSGASYTAETVMYAGGTAYLYNWYTDIEATYYSMTITCSGIGDDEYVYSYSGDFTP